MKKIPYFVLLMSTMFPSTFTVYAQQPDASQLFQRGKTLIDNNCSGECVGATKEALREGMTLIQQAIDEGYENKVKAYLKLAEGYDNLAGLYGKGSPEWDDFFKKGDEVRLMVCRKYDEDVDALVACLDVVMDPEEDQQIRRKILEKDAGRSSVRFGYGLGFLQKGNWHEGFNQIIQSVQSEDDFEELSRFTRDFVEWIQQPKLYHLPFRCEASRAELLTGTIERIRWFSNSADFVKTTPIAIEEFKAMFKKEVNRIECTSNVKK